MQAWFPLLMLVLAASPATGQAPPDSTVPPDSQPPQNVPVPMGTIGPRARARLREVPIVFDMGSVGPTSRGALRVRADTRDIGYSWSGGIVKDRARSAVSDPIFATFAESDDATFLVAMDPPDTLYTIEFLLGDPAWPRGPMWIVINGIPTFDAITTSAGEKRVLSARVEPENGRFAIRLRTDDCRGFALGGLTIRGPKGGRLGKLFGDTLNMNVPPPAEIATVSHDGAKSLLREFCDFLVDNRPHQGGFSYHGAWYQNAYAIRTLVSGSQLLRSDRWMTPAVECMDAFVAQQGRDANWLASYNARSSCHSEETADSSSANLADIGSMTTCLALVLPLVDEERRNLWTEALENYAEHVSLPGQRSDGSYANGRFENVDYPHPYTVATASQTASLAALYKATQDRRYLEAAQKGARWLADNSFTVDGEFLMRPHDRATIQVRESTDFGNLFYVADALILTRSISTDDSLRAAIDRAMDRWLFGSRGLKAMANFEYWWGAHDPWGDSKMGGMLYVLASYPNRTRAGLREWLRLGLGWMADRDRRATIGITKDPASVRGDYALPATGYAGLGVAALLGEGADEFFSAMAPADAPADSTPGLAVPVSDER